MEKPVEKIGSAHNLFYKKIRQLGKFWKFKQSDKPRGIKNITLLK